MRKNSDLVWVTGIRTKITSRSVTIRALDRTGRLRSAVLAMAHLHMEEKVVAKEEYRFLVPQWWAYQEKLTWQYYQQVEKPQHKEIEMTENIGDPSNYEELAMRTAKIMDDKIQQLVHGGMGCASEAGELAQNVAKYNKGFSLDGENFLEELGDALWFATYTAVTLNSMWHAPNERQDHLPADIPTATLDLCGIGGEVASIIKAHVFYGKALDNVRLMYELNKYVTAVFNLGYCNGFTPGQIMASNIVKLRKRYAEKYSDQAAIERADKMPGAFDEPPIGGATTSYVAQDAGREQANYCGATPATP